MAQIDSKTEFLSVPELAAYLKCTPEGLYNLIRREKLGESQGIYRPFHKQRPIRVHLQAFLDWRGGDQPPTTEQPKGVVAEVLGMLMPISTQVSQLAETITQAIQRLHKLYEYSGEGEEQPHDCSNNAPNR